MNVAAARSRLIINIASGTLTSNIGARISARIMEGSKIKLIKAVHEMIDQGRGGRLGRSSLYAHPTANPPIEAITNPIGKMNQIGMIQ
jgi:hypothetical protein